MIRNGLPRNGNNVHTDIRQYFNVQDELSIEDRIVMKGYQVVVTQNLQRDYITCVHQGHPSFQNKRKERVQETLYLTGMNKQTKQEVSSYSVVRPSIRRGPLQTSFYSSVCFSRCVRMWLVRPILVQKVLLQLGQGRLSPGSSVLALSFLVSLLSSATRVRFSSQSTAPLCVRERQPGLSVAASSQVSGFMLKALREAFKVSLNRLRWPP